MKRLKTSKQEMISIPQEVGSILAEGLTFKGGSLSGVGRITLNCYFVGHISTNDLVIVDEAGNILGDIEAQSVIVRGNVKGNIVAVEGVQLQTGGVLNGNITCADLTIASGAAFSGECNMTASKKESNILVSIADKSDEAKPALPMYSRSERPERPERPERSESRQGSGSSSSGSGSGSGDTRSGA